MIVILGSGALGSIFGGRLTEARESVVLIDTWREHVDEMNNNGLNIEGVGGSRVIPVRAVTSPKEVEGKVELVIILVKSMDTETTIEDALPIIGNDTLVMTLQNGLGNAERIAEIVGGEKVIAGVTSDGATLLGPGHVRHIALGSTTIGPLTGEMTERVKETADLLTKAGFHTGLSTDVPSTIWDKLLVNAGINALTAVLRVPNGYLVKHKSAEKLLEMVLKESVEVCRAKGIKLERDPIEYCKQVARNTAGNLSSMYQDVLNRRPSEIDYINGAIAREGKRYGIETPVNEVLVKMVKAVEEGYEG